MTFTDAYGNRWSGPCSINGNTMQCSDCNDLNVWSRAVSDWSWPYRCFTCDPPKGYRADDSLVPHRTFWQRIKAAFR